MFSVRPTDDSEGALGGLLARGLDAAPVVDPQRRLLGFFSVRDGLRRPGSLVSEAMTSPAQAIAEDATLEAAGRALEQGSLQRAAAIDTEGRVVAVITASDVLRGLLRRGRTATPRAVAASARCSRTAPRG